MASKSTKAAPAAAAPQAATNGNSRTNLYMSVDTFEAKTGKTIGGRIVDLYHFGTRPWLQGHLWWAMHNGHTVEVNPATDEQIVAYTAAGAAALAAKFNGTAEAAPAAPAEATAA